MLSSLGRGLAPSNTLDKSSTVFNFTTSLPADFTINRNDAVTCATRRNASGKLVTVPYNTARFDYDTSGNALGMLTEGLRTNKLALYNASPTATTGISVATGTAVLSIVTDANLTAAGLDNIGNGKVLRIDNSAQATSAVISFATTFGATTAHSISLWGRVATSHMPTLTRSGTSPQTLNMTGGNIFKRYKLENITGHTASDTMRINVPAACDLYVILYQMEEGAFASSEIVTNGAATTRQADRVRALNLASRSWYNMAQGYMLARYRPYILGNVTDQYILYASDCSASNNLGLRLGKDTKDLQCTYKVAAAGVTPTANTVVHMPGFMNIAAFAWKSDKLLTLQGGMARTAAPAVGLPTNLNEFAVGSRSGGNDTLWGWISSVEVGLKYKEQGALGSRMYRPSDLLIVGAGQSLMNGYFQSQESSTSGGRTKMLEILSPTRNFGAVVFADGATSGTAAAKTSDAADYWWDLVAKTRGPALNNFYAAIRDAGLTPQIILWSQGEADSHQIVKQTTRSEYKSCLQAIFSDMRTSLGNPKVIIQSIGRRSAGYTNGANAGIQTVREVQKEIAAENPSWCFMGGETYDLPLYDGTHPTDAGYIAAAERNARKIRKILGETISGVDGSRMINASRSGTTVTVVIQHDGGSDFTPAAAIKGFVFFAGATQITVTNAVRSGPAIVTLTLASAPAGGPETLYYGYDAVSEADSGFLKDNAAVSMPLLTGKITL